MKSTFLALGICLCLGLNAQDKDKKVPRFHEGVDPKYIYMYKDATLENDDYKIYIVDPKSENSYAKFKIRIFNKTNDFLIFKPSEFSFIINEQDLASKDKQIIVPPNEEVSRTVDVKGRYLQTKNYTFEIKNYYKIPANASVKAEDFQLPPTSKEFSVATFKCKVLESKLRTDKSLVRIGCTYEGDGIGILDPTKAVAVMPNGKDNANLKKYNATLVEKGKTEDFFVELKEIPGGGDMQKSPFKIKWNDTFHDAKLSAVQGSKIGIEIDAARTVEANK